MANLFNFREQTVPYEKKVTLIDLLYPHRLTIVRAKPIA